MGAIYFQGLQPSSGHLFLLIWDELEIWLKSQKPKLEKRTLFFRFDRYCAQKKICQVRARSPYMQTTWADKPHFLLLQTSLSLTNMTFLCHLLGLTNSPSALKPCLARGLILLYSSCVQTFLQEGGVVHKGLNFPKRFTNLLSGSMSLILN